MKFKKIISVLLCVAILMSSFFCINIVSFAQTNPTVYSDINASQFNAGDTIQIPISIKNNTGIMGWMLTFSYDADVFEPISVEYGEVISGGIQDNIEGDAQPGSFNVYWAGSENETYNGIMFYVNLKIKEDALVHSSTIYISYSQEDTFDEDFNDVQIDCNRIWVYINANEQYSKWYSGMICDAKAGYGVTASTITAGDELYLGLYQVDGSNDGEDFVNSTCTINVEYDKDNFTFLGYTDENYEVYDEIKVENDGIISMYSNATEDVYALHEQEDYYIDCDATHIYYFKFKVNDNAMSGDYTFKYSIVDYEGVDIVKTTDFVATVLPSSTSEIAKIYADDVTANYDDTITVPVKIENNHGIMGYRLRFEYDPTQLEIISAENGESFTGNFNDSIGNKSGEFDVLWNTTENNSTDGTLLKLNFKIITEDKLTSTIKVSYLQEDTFNESYNDVVFDCKDINVSLNNHTHAWSDWIYNGDAVYNSSSDYKNGTQTRTCNSCGEEETIEAPNTALLRRRGNALALESSITLTTYITKDIVDYYDEVYAEFIRGDKTTNVSASEKTYTSGSTIYNIFDYKGISPQAMGDDIEITFYAVKDGVTYWGETYTYSVTTYVQSTLAKTTSSKLKTMLVDLMYYGEACQVYSNYKTDNLMTNILTDEQKNYRSTDTLNLNNIKDSSYKTCENRLVKFGTALRLNNAVEIAIPLNMSNVTLDELTFKVNIGTRNLTYTYADNPENFEYKNGYWYFYFDGVYANQMSDEVFITAYKGDEQVSYTLKYSVESYAATVTDTKLKNVTDTMMRYGNSAKAYSSK